MRPEVEELISRGRLPSSDSDFVKIQQWQETLEKINPPLSNEEAAALIELFPADEDECYGLAWTLVHIVETAPSWPLQECLENEGNPWIARLIARLPN